jgi:hypothetical protein
MMKLHMMYIYIYRDEINEDNVCQSAKQYIVLPTSFKFIYVNIKI